MLTMIWARAETMRAAPGVPMTRTGVPFRRTTVGAMLLAGRRPGPMAFGPPAAPSKSARWLLSRTPVPGTTTPEPKKLLMLWVRATTLPFSSATERWDVLSDSGMTSDGGA